MPRSAAKGPTSRSSGDVTNVRIARELPVASALADVAGPRPNAVSPACDGSVEAVLAVIDP